MFSCIIIIFYLGVFFKCEFEGVASALGVCSFLACVSGDKAELLNLCSKKHH